MDYAIAVLDIGKTNKKLVIYDENLGTLDSVYRSIPTIKHEELDVEDVAEIETWFLKVLKEMAEKYPIRAVSITTHGATCACVDEEGEPALPVVAYTNEVDEDLHRDFYNEMGSPDELQLKTGTAQVRPLINLAKLIYFMKKRFPEGFARTKRILFYPQYFAGKLTGKAAADCSYLGCHTYLWDFEESRWSHLCDRLGIRDLLPEKVSRPGDVLGRISPEMARKTGLSGDTLITVGVHDSNSSLIPYLVKGEENFILNSTGTWCVVMHPSKNYGFREDEIGKTVFYNISAREELVKTAIFMGGLEFQTYRDLILEVSGKDEYPRYEQETVQKILDGCSDFIIPGIVKGAGQFPDSEPRYIGSDREYSLADIQKGDIPPLFHENQEAYAVLNLSLAIQTRVALDRIKAPVGSPVYVEGGFRKNKTYLTLLASLNPESPVYTTDISEATSFGAAMLGKAALEGKEPGDYSDLVEIEMNRVMPDDFRGLDKYMAGFLDFV